MRTGSSGPVCIPPKAGAPGSAPSAGVPLSSGPRRVFGSMVTAPRCPSVRSARPRGPVLVGRVRAVVVWSGRSPGRAVRAGPGSAAAGSADAEVTLAPGWYGSAAGALTCPERPVPTV
ncbi:hypothetical protein GCM10017688_36410 [Streptomyces ramulosus]